jgi:hypothetical protein
MQQQQLGKSQPAGSQQSCQLQCSVQLLLLLLGKWLPLLLLLLGSVV